MVSDDRSDRVSSFARPVTAAAPSAPGDVVIGSNDARSASFDVGGFTLELVGSEAGATLAIVGRPDRDTYHIDPVALEHWADGTERLLGLTAAAGPTECADFRAPFLMDVQGRASIAFESAVTEGGVAHRLLLMRSEGRVATLPTAVELVRDLVDAARGAARFVRSGSSWSR